MIQGAVIRVIGVVLGLFVIFSVVSPVAGGLDELYLHSIDSCNFGDASNPERALIIGTNSDWASTSDADPDDVNWNNDDDRRELIRGEVLSDALIIGNSNNTRVSGGITVVAGNVIYQPFTTGPTPIEIIKVNYYLESVIDNSIYVAIQESGSNGLVSVDSDIVSFVDIPGGFNNFIQHENGINTYYTLDLRHTLNANTLYYLSLGVRAVDASGNPTTNSVSFGGFAGSDKDNENSKSSNGWSIGNYSREGPSGSFTITENTEIIYFELFTERDVVNEGSCALSTGEELSDGTVWTSANGDVDFLVSGGDAAIVDTINVSGLQTDPFWAEPAGLFDEQPQLVELLATIAALALPLGALGAVVFFGNTISVATGTSGVSSQIIAVITIVVVILVIVEVFGQFIVYLDQAFEVIDKDRFAVYDNGLGTLAETITSFWGILAFASVLPIGFSLFRQYQSGGGIAGFGGNGRGV